MSSTDLVMGAAGIGGGDATYVEDVFSTYLYTGTGTSQTITNGIKLGDSSIFASQNPSALPTSSNRNYQALSANSSIAIAHAYIGGSPFSTNAYASSTDGVTWTNQTMPVSSAWFGSAYGNGTFVATSVAIPSLGLTSVAYRSSNGTSWSSSSGFPTGFETRRTRYTNSQFFIVGQTDGGGDYPIYGSTNGSSWTTYNTNLSARIEDITYGSGYYVAISSANIFYSTNLTSWTSATSGSALQSACFGGGVFVVGGGDGVRRSTNGTSWSLVSGSPTGVSDLVYDGTKFIGIRDNGVVVTSTNGLTWSSYASNTTTSFGRVALLGTKTIFIQVSNNNRYAGVINSFVPESIGKGGLVWIKTRNNTNAHTLWDTARGVGNFLTSNNTDANTDLPTATGTNNYDLNAFNANGFGLGTGAFGANVSGGNMCSWTFRKQPKFFDVVTYTGDGSSNRQISHNLGSVPGMILVKRTDTTSNWRVYHRSLPSSNYFLNLNATTEQLISSNVWTSTAPTASVFNIGTDPNASGGTYVAYLFAHNAGGFGAAGTDNVISCGSFTGLATVDLGYEPQWLLYKSAFSANSGWLMVDNMRGFTAEGDGDAYLEANASAAEASGNLLTLTSTGFTNKLFSGDTFIYMAIRRPMKVPTTGTEVFNPVTYTGADGSNRVISTTVRPDMTMWTSRDGSAYQGTYVFDRMRSLKNTGGGSGGGLRTSQTAAESSNGDYQINRLNNNSVQFGSTSYYGFDLGSVPGILWNFSRAPNFFDVVCTSVFSNGTTIAHNLGVTPELILVKTRDSASNWMGAVNDAGSIRNVSINTNSGGYLPSLTYATYFNATTIDPAGIYNGGGGSSKGTGLPVVIYLFASCPGVSKVGSYTGNGSSQTINCGFAAGARFVMIKRTDDVGDWLVWDSARGIVSGSDPYLRVNTTAGENSYGAFDDIDPQSSGFTVNSTGNPYTGNASGASYIYLAIA